jgi:hypothetical protein
MLTKEAAILGVLSRDRRLLTAPQIASQVNSVLDDHSQVRLTDADVRKTLVQMERDGVLDRDVDGQRIERFRRRMPRYAFGMEGCHWRIVRVIESAADVTHSFLTDDMTEAEARCCVTALNEMERKATALLRRR